MEGKSKLVSGIPTSFAGNPKQVLNGALPATVSVGIVIAIVNVNYRDRYRFYCCCYC